MPLKPAIPRAGRETPHPRSHAVDIRSAVLADLAQMDQVALEAKAHWGYSGTQLSLWAPDLMTSPESLASWPTLVAEQHGLIVGFAQLDPTGHPWELVSLWVRPLFMRRGMGSLLLRHMQAVARYAGVQVIHIDADPHAAPFYKACGAIEVGSVAAPIEGQPGRVRPQFRLATDVTVTPLRSGGT